MSDSRLEELATLAALGAATDVERAELDRLVANDPAAAAEVARWEATAHAFAESLEPMEPPANGLENLRAEIEAQSTPGKRTIVGPAPVSLEPPVAVGTPEYAESEPKAPPAKSGEAEIISLAARRQRRMLGGGLAVALAAAAALLFMFLRERDRANGALEELQAAVDGRERAVEAVRKDAQVEIEKLAKQLESTTGKVKTLTARFEPLRSAKLELATLAADGGGYAHVFADRSADGEKAWLVVADSLPAIGADQDYQLWFVPADGKPVSAGLLRAGPDGVMSATPEVPSALAGTKLRPAISLEPRGGSPQPTQVKLIGDPI